VRWSSSFPATKEINPSDKGVLVSGLAVCHVFHPQVKSSNLILPEEDEEEFVYQGFPIGML